MAHEVYLSIPEQSVVNKDVEFSVYSDEELLGTLKVSKGTIEWKQTNDTYGYHLSWETFDKLMAENGTRKNE